MKENSRKLLWIVLVALLAFELGFKPIGFAPIEKPSDLSEATYTFERSLVGIPPKPLPSAKPAAATESAPENSGPESINAESLALSPEGAPQPAFAAQEAPVAGESAALAEQPPYTVGAESLPSESQPGAPPKAGMTADDLDSEMWTYLDQQGVPLLQDGVTVADREVRVQFAIPRDTQAAQIAQYRNDALAALQAQYGDRAGVASLKQSASAQKDRNLVVWQVWRIQVRKPVPQVKLGLDLQGGTRIVMEAVPLTHYVFIDQAADVAGLTQGTESSESTASIESGSPEAQARAQSQVASAQEWERISGELKTYLEGQGWRVFEIVPNAAGVTLDVVTARQEDADAALSLARDFLRRQRPDVVHAADGPQSVLIKPDTIQRVREIMQRRVDLFGLSEPVIQTQGKTRITIEVAGQTPENMKDAMSEPADLKLMFIDPARYQLRTVPIPANQRDPRNPAKTERIDVYDAISGRKVEHKKAVNDPRSKVIIRGADMKDTSQAMPGQSGAWEVSFELKRYAADTFRDFTSKHINQPLAIVLNGVIESAPNIQTTIGAQGRIMGHFTIQQANNLKTLLNAGALPIKLEMKENRSVSATLGASNVQKSLFAGLLGLMLVYAFMFAYYRLPGLMADVALTLYCGIVLATLVMFNAVLTLTGIAGLILGVGMAVDANILIFERMKEELRTKSLPMSLKVGFERAWTAIFDSNSTTLITGSIMWLLGTGGVRGFATTLIVSVLASLFTAVYVSRALLEVVISTSLGRHARLFLGARPEAMSREDARRGRRPL